MFDSVSRRLLGTASNDLGTNQIDRFQRLPSDLRKYLEYKEWIVAEYGSVMRFVVKERLRWGDGSPDDLKPRGRPFEFDGEFVFNLARYGSL